MCRASSQYCDCSKSAAILKDVDGKSCILFLVLVLLTACSWSTKANGERVGFQFQGTIGTGGQSSTSLFNTMVSNGATVYGTFSYDTTSAGQDVSGVSRVFNQTIEGGLDLMIGDSLSVKASRFKIIVSNDAQNGLLDSFAVSFNRLNPITDPPVLINEIPWSSIAIINIEFKGAADVLADKVLTPAVPSTIFPGALPQGGYITSSGIPLTLSIVSLAVIEPLAGDYSGNGIVDAADFIEWKAVFGHNSTVAPYADGNGDGQVNLADYTVWRDNLGSEVSNLRSSHAESVPEPTCLGYLSLALMCYGVLKRSKFAWGSPCRSSTIKTR